MKNARNIPLQIKRQTLRLNMHNKETTFDILASNNFDYAGSKILIESTVKAGVKDSKDLEALKKAAAVFDSLFYATDANLKEILRAALGESLSIYRNLLQKQFKKRLTLQAKLAESVVKKFGGVSYVNFHEKLSHLSESASLIQVFNSVTDVILYFLIMQSHAYTNKLAFVIDVIGFFSQLGSLALIAFSGKIGTKTQALLTGLVLGLLALPVVLSLVIYIARRFKKGDFKSLIVEDPEFGGQTTIYVPKSATRDEKIASRKLATYITISTLKSLAVQIISLVNRGIIITILRLLPEPLLKFLHGSISKIMAPVNKETQKQIQNILKSNKNMQHAAYLYVGQILGSLIVLVVAAGIASYLNQRYGIRIFDKLIKAFPITLVGVVIQVAVGLILISFGQKIETEIDVVNLVNDKSELFGESSRNLQNGNTANVYLQEAKNILDSASRLLKKTSRELTKVIKAILKRLAAAVKQAINMLKTDKYGFYRTVLLSNFASLISFASNQDSKSYTLELELNKIKQYIDTSLHETTVIIGSPIDTDSIYATPKDIVKLLEKKLKLNSIPDDKLYKLVYALIFATTYKRFLEAFDIPADKFKPRFFLAEEGPANAFCLGGRVTLINYRYSAYSETPLVYIAGIIAHELGHCYFQMRNLGYTILKMFAELLPINLVQALLSSFNLNGFYPILTTTMFSMTLGLILQADGRFFELEADAASHIAIGGAIEGLVYLSAEVSLKDLMRGMIFSKQTKDLKKETIEKVKSDVEKAFNEPEIKTADLFRTNITSELEYKYVVKGAKIEITKRGEYIFDLDEHGTSTARITAIIANLKEDKKAFEEAKRALARSAQIWDKLWKSIQSADDVTALVEKYIKSTKTLI